MIFKDCYPKVPVDQLVQVYRLRHFIVPPNMKVTPKPYPARPEQCITFYIRGSEYSERSSDHIRMYKPRLVITGQYTELVNRYCASNEFLMIQAVFYPGMLHRLTGIPFKELQNSFVDFEEIMPKEGREVMDRLYHVKHYPEMISIVDNFIEGLANREKIEERPIDQVFRTMLDHPCIHTIEWYSKEACLSPRQFERNAYNYLGINPKQFARISRFIQSYEMRQKYPKADWSTIAISCGYHDYQHLIRDYTSFANHKPNGLFEADSYSMERKLGLFNK